MERERAFVDEIKKKSVTTRSRIHEHTILLRFLGIILRVLRLEDSVYNVYNDKPVSNHFCSRGRGRGE
jgi:hypothetical protein